MARRRADKPNRKGRLGWFIAISVLLHVIAACSVVVPYAVKSYLMGRQHAREVPRTAEPGPLTEANCLPEEADPPVD